MTLHSRWTLFAAIPWILVGCGSGSGPSAGRSRGGAVGAGGAGGGTSPTETGGSMGSGGASSVGPTAGGGTSGWGGAGSGSGGATTAVGEGGFPAGGISGTGGAAGAEGGSTGTRDAGSANSDAGPDAVAPTGGVLAGGTMGRGGGSAGGAVGGGGRAGGGGTTGGGGAGPTGGSAGSRDGGPPAGGGGGGVTATGGAASGGATGTVAACATNEVSKCASGSGPLGAEIKCDFGGGDGNYDVTVEVGGDVAGDTYVDAEMYRRMLPELTTIAGQPQRFAFTVNVRTPEGQPVEVGNTDSVPGLQVYFRGPAPKVNAICHQAANKPLMVWIGGDSTVCDQDSTNYTGWGQRLPQLMQGPVSIANYADSGESSGSFLGSSAMFGAIKSRWKAGDWFLVQLGHNDKTTTAQTFQSNMTSYVTQAKAAGVSIVLITPISRVGYTLAEEHVNSTGANLPQIIRDLGQSENVPVIDLTVTTWNWIQTITPKDYFAADSSASGGYDHTHLGPKGADAVAGFVRDAIKANPGVPGLAPYLR